MPTSVKALSRLFGHRLGKKEKYSRLFPLVPPDRQGGADMVLTFYVWVSVTRRLWFEKGNKIEWLIRRILLYYDKLVKSSWLIL